MPRIGGSSTSGGGASAVAGVAPDTLEAALRANRVDVQVFTFDGTWTKPAGALTVEVAMVAGGAGGGSGRRGAAATVRCGGGGGGGGGFQRVTLPATALPDTVAVVVGQGANGGAAITTDSTDGAGGNTGGTTTFGAYARVGSALRGNGGSATAGAGGAGSGVVAWTGGAGGNASTTGGNGANGTSGAAAGGGGAGGGITTGNVAGNGGAGGGANANGNTGGTAGVVGGATPTTPDAITGAAIPNGGGGGGAASITGAAQAGAPGSTYGGGGGGGGASLNGFASGAGGRGGNGVVVVTTTVREPVRLFPRVPPAVPATGTTLLGTQTMNATTDLAQFLTAAGQTQAAIWSTFTTNNGTFTQAISDAKNLPTGTELAIAWSFPGSTNQAGVAAGTDDAYITARANELADYGKPVHVRLNWEMQGNWYPYSAYTGSTPIAGNTPANYVAAWQRTVTAVRAIAPNAVFEWCPHLWDPQPAGTGLAVTDWYPGDTYVDWVGVTAYPGSAVWDWVANGTWGLTAFADFATTHGKPMVIDEWGMGQNTGDDPTLVDAFADWVDAHPVVRAVLYFHMSGVNGVDYRLSAYPLSAARYRTRFPGVPGRYRSSS